MVYTTDVTVARGQVKTLRVVSEKLRGNPLGDPHERALHVYLPPGYDATGNSTRYPVVYLLSGFTGSGAVDAQLDRLAGEPSRQARPAHR